MKKPQLETRHHHPAYKSYVVGFILSVITTVTAYFFVVNSLLPTEALIYIILILAIIQLVVQMVFFLHIGRGSRWKTLTFVFTLLVVLIIVIGTLWIMHNLDYNMMHMSPDEVHTYMEQHEGI